MLRKIWPLVILVLGISLLVTAYVMSRPASEDQVQENQQQATISPDSAEPLTGTTTVTYTNEGFSPDRITIARGATVSFINESDIPLWVASDPHPSHTDYPEFDTPAVLGRMPRLEEDFSFTFDKVGEWKYHSHTASGDTTSVGLHPGVVIVK